MTGTTLSSLYHHEDPGPAFRKSLLTLCRQRFPANVPLAIKLHMGEPGNRYFLPASFVQQLVIPLREAGWRPFLFDSPVIYPGPRRTAEKYLAAAAGHGFTPEAMGCPVKISDLARPVKGKYLTYGICEDLLGAGGVLFLSHVKGHFCTGCGAALKNLGMGGMSSTTKGAIHQGGKPEWCGDCTGCGDCAARCPTGHIGMENGKAVFNKSFCVGCSNCVHSCPASALRPKLATFDALLLDGIALALQRMPPTVWINAAVNISRHCDCMVDAGEKVAPDAGYVLGPDPVAVDQAAWDLIRHRAGRDIFEEIHHVPASRLLRDACARKIGETSYTWTNPIPS